MTTWINKLDKGICIYNFKTIDAYELNLEVGDFLQILGVRDDKWLIVKKGSAVGFVPKSHVLINPSKINIEKGNEKNKLQKVVDEILSTEQDYIKYLYIIIEVYLKPLLLISEGKTSGLKNLKKRTKFPKIAVEDINLLFANVKSIYKLHVEFYDNLLKTDNDILKIAKVFNNTLPYFEFYTEYCENFQKSIQIFKFLKSSKKDFQIFLEESQGIDHDEYNVGLSLDYYLILPVQRICKYNLFFKEILSYFKVGDQKYNILRDTYNTIVHTNTQINNNVRRKENNEKVSDIFKLISKKLPFCKNENREIIDIKELFIDNKKVICYFFNDFFIILSQTIMTHKTINYYGYLIDVTISDRDYFNYSYTITTNNNKFSVICKEEKLMIDSLNLFTC